MPKTTCMTAPACLTCDGYGMINTKRSDIVCPACKGQGDRASWLLWAKKFNLKENEVLRFTRDNTAL